MWALIAVVLLGLFTLLALMPTGRKGRPRLELEVLGVRITPAGNVCYWAGPAGGLWSVAADWQGKVVPGGGDSVNFSTVNTASTDDIAGLKLANMGIMSGYTSKITLSTNLEVDGNLYMQGGTIAATGTNQLTLPQALSNFTWAGGTIDSTATVILGGPGAVATLNINGGPVTLNGTLISTANATLSGTGNIVMANANAKFFNEVGSTFNIVGGQGFQAAAGLNPVIQNGGLFEKTGGATSEIDAIFTNTNNGTLLAQTGTLKFTARFQQTVGGVTQLYGGAISCIDNNNNYKTFAMAGGILEGVGTFTGNVTQTGGDIVPGYGSPTGGSGSAGTLTITGDYTEGGTATLVINTDPSNVSRLNVQGTVDVQGALLVNRDPEFAATSGTFPFLTWTTINPNDYFNSVTYTDNSWGGCSFAVVEALSMDQFDLVINPPG